ncbi:ATP-binding cassette domain-containing protein [Sphingomonas sp. BT-65]|uniref:ATP-binding cassette domain-containing protein n=1 Tax=Sphingomonas sp. BT-65 TaxID=2989821 RepID=UPI0022366EB2|nr:ATP-binding cassette domain-containing protein [Sphingomonas sp. BT-65]MCW4463646.1 ATP-binding cassette domain-containing protein [Sphingomonas sp. BT-65]
MSFDIAVEKRRGDAEIACRIEGGTGITVLFGPSGAGKTSVLDMVAGLLRPDKGQVRVGGETLFDAAAGVNLPPERRRAGYVFQDSRLFPHLSVRANLLYGAGGDPSGLDELATRFGIAHLLDRWPRSLSGGEARRVAIGRALLAKPAFLLLDEPLSSLDRARREEIMQVIEQLRDESGLPILMVTHDQAEAERLGDRIVEL